MQITCALLSSSVFYCVYLVASYFLILTSVDKTTMKASFHSILHPTIHCSQTLIWMSSAVQPNEIPAELHWFCSFVDISHTFYFKFVSKLSVLLESSTDYLAGLWLSALMLGTITRFSRSFTGNLIYFANSLK